MSWWPGAPRILLANIATQEFVSICVYTSSEVSFSLLMMGVLYRSYLNEGDGDPDWLEKGRAGREFNREESIAQEAETRNV